MLRQVPFKSAVRALAVLALLPMLGGCEMVVLNPAGDIARQQGQLIVMSTLLMLLCGLGILLIERVRLPGIKEEW